MAIAHRGEPERAVLARIAFVPDADEGRLEQAYHRCVHLLARQPRPAQVRRDPAPDDGQCARELGEAAELILVAHAAPLRMVAVLLASARVATRGLEMAACGSADPHVRPGRRNGERADAIQDGVVAHRLACRIASELQAITRHVTCYLLRAPSVSALRIHRGEGHHADPTPDSEVRQETLSQIVVETLQPAARHWAPSRRPVRAAADRASVHRRRPARARAAAGAAARPSAVH